MKKQFQILALMSKYLALAAFILAIAVAFYYLYLTWNDFQNDYSIFIQLTPALQEDISR